MSISLPPPPAAPKKKSGLGCLGCGCGALLLIVVLAIGLVIAAAYAVYDKAKEFTSTTAADVPTFSGDPAVKDGAQQKVQAFHQAADAHQPASLHLSSDEINALIAANPDLQQKHIRVHVTLAKDEATVEASVPIDSLAKGLYPDRYINFNGAFSASFDAKTKQVLMTPSALQIGDKVLMDPNTPDAADSTNATLARARALQFNQFLNQFLRNDPKAAQILDHATNITIQDGELIIETN